MDKSAKAAEQELKPLIEWAKANPGAANKPGAFALIAAAMSKKIGRKIHRQHVEKWLHSDASKRTQPLYGTGLLLAEVGKELIQQANENASNKPA